ncbi:iron(III) transport system substrate-binding protein [Pseudooceanicola antarcticus]|uniref:Iron ABC transporter substrate-binding protein n=1 Tax=Pseudooceanicola antarcticus TaxID=1247613 RepID=A0A285IWF5_9RHOB|nr:Fe(3+) ABC transporter substrate-binding protein [Pseudooceanicola antarcticus]PJE25933.1 iron ABC transporter substrate-binding protein [Pseudooceanicola antarcticus]SNY52324.1 iron(III) transport system substrate-binding protein [Pseudooceanicola antarcticus]
MYPRFLPALALCAASALPAAAAEEVNLYSYRQPELIAPLVDAFTAKTGIPVNVAYLEKGMVERLKAEGMRSPADLVLTVDISRLSAIVDADVTQAVSDPVLEAAIPAHLRDPEGRWFGVTTRARVVYASKERVADGELTSYEDLADPKWEGRICTRSGTHPYNVALVAAYLHHHGEEATKTWLEGVRANLARKPQGNDRAQVRAIWAGECDISLGNTYYMGKMLEDPEQQEWADSVRIIFPTFEDGGAHVNISGIAMTKAAPNKETAMKFMEFLVSPEGQEIYAEKNYEYPVTADSQPSELVASWGSFEADDVALMDLAALRPDALRLIEEVDFDS